MIVVFALRKRSDAEQTDIVREIFPRDMSSIDFKGSESFDLTQDQKETITWMLQQGKEPSVFEEVERIADVGNRVAPKVISLLNILRKRDTQ